MGAFTAGRTADGRIRTAQIIGNAALGGVAACALNYYRHADRSFFCSDFFTYGPSRLEEELRAVDPDARVFYLPPLDRRFWQAVPRLTKLLKEGGYASRLIMQEHDELIIDAVPEEAEQMKKLLRDSMENVVQLKVKLEVEVGSGPNWLEAK